MNKSTATATPNGTKSRPASFAEAGDERNGLSAVFANLPKAATVASGPKGTDKLASGSGGNPSSAATACDMTTSSPGSSQVNAMPSSTIVVRPCSIRSFSTEMALATAGPDRNASY